MAYATLNKNNFFNNLDIIAKKTKTKDKIALVLKDNAYGHGFLEMAKMAQEYGLTRCVVQNSKEAKKVAQFFDYVLVLADVSSEACSKTRYAINDVNSISRFAKGTKVELKVDTGMHRNGVSPQELYTAFARIKENGLILEAVFTHHRNADELTSEWFWQNDVFKKIKTRAIELAKEFGFDSLRFHSSNSAALFRTNDFSEDMARIGIAAYGCLSMPKTMDLEGLEPILSLYARKVSTRKLRMGDRVGYGATFEALSDCVVSNYDFGYGDGFLRSCSNDYVTPNGSELAGRVSMDNSSFLCEEEELLIFNDARVASAFAKTIAYEVLTSIKSDVEKRVV